MRWMWLTGWCLVLSVAGCATAPQEEASNLPEERYIVGGGFLIEYATPVAGTAILANQTTEQLLMTRSLDAGEKFEVSLDPTEEETAALLGGDLSQAQVILYFIPRSQP